MPKQRAPKGRNWNDIKIRYITYGQTCAEILQVYPDLPAQSLYKQINRQGWKKQKDETALRVQKAAEIGLSESLAHLKELTTHNLIRTNSLLKEQLLKTDGIFLKEGEKINPLIKEGLVQAVRMFTTPDGKAATVGEEKSGGTIEGLDTGAI